MGRKSTKDNKNIYQRSREKLGLTREAASDLLGYISADRIEKIESEKSTPYPEEIISMADCYKNPMLCNYYCTPYLIHANEAARDALGFDFVGEGPKISPCFLMNLFPLKTNDR